MFYLSHSEVPSFKHQTAGTRRRREKCAVISIIRSYFPIGRALLNIYYLNKEIINHIEIIIPKRRKGHNSPTARRGKLCPISIIFFPKGWQNPCWRKAFGCHRAIVSILLSYNRNHCQGRSFYHPDWKSYIIPMGRSYHPFRKGIIFSCTIMWWVLRVILLKDPLSVPIWNRGVGEPTTHAEYRTLSVSPLNYKAVRQRFD